MKVYTYFTDSHKDLLDYFKLTFKSEPDLEVIVRYGNQVVNGTDITHNYGTGNFIQTVRRKLEYLNDIMDSHIDGDIFIYLDCDIIFFKPIKDEMLKELADYDIAFQADDQVYCTGCFICRVSERTRRLFKDSLNSYTHVDDQDCINLMLKEPAFSNVKVKFLSAKFCNYCKLQHGLYTPDKAPYFLFTSLKTIDPVLYHTNYTIGVQNKLHMTRLILKEMYK